MSKRYAASAALLLLSVFLPWFGVNVVIFKLTVHGYQLHAATYILLILGVAGVVASFLKKERFRGLIEGLVGMLSIITIWVASHAFYSQISQRVESFMGGASSFLGNSGFGGGTSPFGGVNPNQITSMVGNTQFGFYVGVIVSLALLGFGIQAIVTRKTESLLPEKWNMELIKGNVNTLSQGLAETASTVSSQVQSQAKKVDWTKWGLKTTRGRSVLGAVGVIVVYFAGMAWYNSTHSISATVKNLVHAIHSKNSGAVSGLIEAGKVDPQAIPGFVDYYNKNMSSLENLLTPIQMDMSGGSNVQSGNANGQSFNSLFNSTDNSTVRTVKHNFLGYVSYKIAIPATKLSLSGPNSQSSMTYTINGKKIPSTVELLPAAYSVTASVSTPLGPVKETKNVDLTVGSGSQAFGFSQDMVTVQSNDLSTNDKITFKDDGKTIGSTVQQGLSGIQAPVGPVPNANSATIQAVASVPWGTYTETGTVQNGQVQLEPDLTADNSFTQAIGNTINNFNKQDTADWATGNFQPELKYILTNSSESQNVLNDSGTQKFKYLSMNLDPNVQLVQLSDGQTGIAVDDSEFYNSANRGNYEYDWTYHLQYDPSLEKWLITSSTSSYQPISNQAPDIVFKP